MKGKTVADNNGEIRNNLRDAGEALLLAGSSLGAALGKVAGELSERFQSTSDEARTNLNAATSEGDVRNVASNFVDEAEKLFNSLRERDLQISDDLKETVTTKVNEVRAALNERLDKALDGVDDKGVMSDIRSRFDGLVERLQDQFTNTTGDGDIIDGEILETDETDSNNTAN